MVHKKRMKDITKPVEKKIHAYDSFETKNKIFKYFKLQVCKKGIIFNRYENAKAFYECVYSVDAFILVDLT